MELYEVAGVYAKALVEIGVENNMLSDIQQEMSFVASLLQNDSKFSMFLNAPKIPRSQKKAFIEKVFKGNCSDVVMNFLKLLVDNGREDIVCATSESIDEHVDEINNIKRVTLTTSSLSDDSLIEKIGQRVGDVFKKKVIVKNNVNPVILGGMILRIDDLVVDVSLARGMELMRQKLLHSKVRSEAAYED